MLCVCVCRGGGCRVFGWMAGGFVLLWRLAFVWCTTLAPNAHLQVFETCSVADALPAILALESDWYGLLPGYTPDDVSKGADDLLAAM